MDEVCFEGEFIWCVWALLYAKLGGDASPFLDKALDYSGHRAFSVSFHNYEADIDISAKTRLQLIWELENG